MSTKATVAFTSHDGEVLAAVYVHNAGSLTPETFAGFFATVARDCGPEPHDLRFHDPSYLAAKFVVWSAGTASMAFQGVGVITAPERIHAHRRFTVRCHAEPSAVPPEVTEAGRPAAPEPLPDAFNAQAVGVNGLGQVTVLLPRHVMSHEEALVHAAWIVALADPAGEDFPRYLAAVRST